MQTRSLLAFILGITLEFASLSSWAAAPAMPQGFINYYTYPGDQRAEALAGTAAADGSYYPKRAEGPYNGIPEADPGDDETPPASDVRNNYTLHLKGYFYPPKTGQIQLAIACDDPGELYFSSDDNPAHRVRVATESQWNPVRAFGGAWDGSVATRRTVISAGDAPVPRPENWSKFISVIQGKPYHIEAWAVEFGGGDNLAIAVRYDDDAEFADGDKPIPGAQLSPFSMPTGTVITAQPQDTYVFAGSAAAFSVSVDVPPGTTVSSIKWQKNGVDIADSNALTLSLPTTAADDGAKVKAIITTSTGTLASAEATVNVATLASEFAAGLVIWDAFREIGGNSVDNLTDDPKYQADTPDETRFFTSFEAPVNIYEAFGGRLSGFFVPPTNGNYVFFMSCDDNGALYLSTDDNPANKKKIAAETAWSNNREWITSGGNSDLASKRSDQFPETERAGGNTITLQANRRYYLELLYKEGGGGDNGGVAVIREGEPDPASGSATTLTGALVGANAKPNKGDPRITEQPVFPAQLEEGRSYSFSVDAIVTPEGFNFQPIFQWQKNGANIPGATGKTFTIPSASASDAGTYRVVVSAPSGKSVNSVEAALGTAVGGVSELLFAFESSNNFPGSPDSSVHLVFTTPLSSIADANLVIRAPGQPGVQITQRELINNDDEIRLRIPAGSLTTDVRYVIDVGSGLVDINNQPVAPRTAVAIVHEIISQVPPPPPPPPRVLGYPESSRKSLNTKERNFHAKWGLEEMGDSW